MDQIVIWPGWVGGLAIGLYALMQHALSNRALGCSLAYGNFIGFVSKLSFFHRDEFAQLNNWRLWFILGIPLGGYLAVVSSPNAHWTPTFSMGTLYEQVMPESDLLTALIVTFGGFLMGAGARQAGGCTSGHAITGCGALNPPSLLASALFFLGGLVCVQLLFFIFGKSTI